MDSEFDNDSLAEWLESLKSGSSRPLTSVEDEEQEFEEDESLFEDNRTEWQECRDDLLGL